ncbi:hypothetical protein FKM82_015738 [Ascaphus truei]
MVMFIEGTWEARADFSQADVHRQIAIVLKTPPYRDLHITEPAPVGIYLQRLTDGIRSEGLTFTYMPREKDLYGLHNKKRPVSRLMGDFCGPDPHGIEAKRLRKRPAYTDHFTHVTDSNSLLSDSFPYDYWNNPVFVGDEVAGPNQLQLDEASLNFDPFVSSDPCFPPDLVELPDSIGVFDPGLEGEATAHLVRSSLFLTGEEEVFLGGGYTGGKEDDC